MKLKRVIIKGLNNKVDCDSEFHNDINVVTGINGCGKTTLLKMLWYAISGNIDRLLSEISFESFSLETSCFHLSLINQSHEDKGEVPTVIIPEGAVYSPSFISKRSTIKCKWRYISDEIQQNGVINIVRYNPIDERELELLKSLIIFESRDSSLFFPTFRRVEGGYSLINPKSQKPLSNSYRSLAELHQFQRESNNVNIVNIQKGFDSLSNNISFAKHKFICSISTNDLGYLLRLHNAKTTEKIDEYYLALNKSLIRELENLKSGIKDSKDESLAIVSKLQREVADVDNKRDELLQPFKVLSELVTKVMHYKGVKLDDFTIGESDNAIESRLLSAGEQQMLSFLCYNAFYEDSIIFIDEPELSLHADWQRRLFPNLMKQQSSNQFVVATHSPFIYSKYEDKEIVLSEDKGE
jgi:predicted ATPase